MALKRGPIPGAPRIEPWKPPAYEIADAAALQAVALGRASEEQQRRAYRYIVEAIAGTYDQSYRPTGVNSYSDTVFAEGRRFVGLQMVKFAKLNLDKLRGKVTEQGTVPAQKPKENP